MILSFIPFFMIFFFLVIKKYKSYKVMIGVFLFTFLMILGLWKVDFLNLVFASIKGFISAIEIFLIILSILLLFNLLKDKKKLDGIRDFMKSYTDDKNILIILIGFFLVSFFEGIAGFGTPAAICVPILVFLGVDAMTSIIVCLMADSIAVSFGAFGTPVLLGLKEFTNASEISSITFFIGIISLILSIVLPFLMIVIYNKSIKKPFTESLKYLKVCFVSGLSFGILFLVSSMYLNTTVVSVIASVGGLILTLIYLNTTKFVKKNVSRKPFELLKNFSAYLVIVILLILSRIKSIGFGDFLKTIGFSLDFGSGIKSSFNFYSPGILILFVFILFLFVYLTKKSEIESIVSKSFNQGKFALITLIFTLMFVQILIFSNLNDYGINSVLEFVGVAFSKTGIFYIILSPIIGAFGSFITGSATVSNLIFGSLQTGVSEFSIYSKELILALQTLGGGAGNMIAIHNIIAACSLVGLKNHESDIIKNNLKIVLIYCLIASGVGIFIYFIF